MCLTCGCGMPYDKMGDDNNIVVDDIKKAVSTDDAKGQTTDQAVQNLVKTWAKVKDEDKQHKSE